ncbi:hypothetical protein OXX80_007918 [Metschnikowia pulcherrima]
MGYYDIDDILADGEKIPCKFNLTVPGLGYLEGNPGKSIEKDTKLDLPLWLAAVLAVCTISDDTDDSFVDLLEPDFISPKVLNAIKADPKSVDLHSIMSNFYRLSEKWAAMYNEESLIETVMAMLKERALEIDNFASNTTKHVSSSFLYSLDEFEKKLYRVTYESKKSMRAWTNN